MLYLEISFTMSLPEEVLQEEPILGNEENCIPLSSRLVSESVYIP